MRYASLISGGKDSCLAHHVAAQWGFTPTVGIVIRPRDPESHMFHLPNLDLAAAQVDALGLDRVEVQAPAGKETETQILEDAFEAAVERGVETIVSGAVASEYQRTRIERAADLVGVKTHTPLWHKDPLAILDTLVHGGFDVRFSAVAADGMDRSWLGRRLDHDARDALEALEASHGVHPGGEGGEYESLVLDAPMFRHRIEVTDADTTWDRDRGRWQVTGWRTEGR